MLGTEPLADALVPSCVSMGMGNKDGSQAGIILHM